jgi:hypothetical protein
LVRVPTRAPGGGNTALENTTGETARFLEFGPGPDFSNNAQEKAEAPVFATIILDHVFGLREPAVGKLDVLVGKGGDVAVGLEQSGEGEIAAAPVAEGEEDVPLPTQTGTEPAWEQWRPEGCGPTADFFPFDLSVLENWALQSLDFLRTIGGPNGINLAALVFALAGAAVVYEVAHRQKRQQLLVGLVPGEGAWPSPI